MLILSFNNSNNYLKMTNNQDPYTDVVIDVHQKSIIAAKIEHDKFNTTCIEAARKLATELKTIDSPLHKVTTNRIREFGSRETYYLERSDIPRKLRRYFDTLHSCYDQNFMRRKQLDKEVLENEFKDISNSLLFKPYFGTGDDPDEIEPFFEIGIYNKKK